MFYHTTYNSNKVAIIFLEKKLILARDLFLTLRLSAHSPDDFFTVIIYSNQVISLLVLNILIKLELLNTADFFTISVIEINITSN